MQKLIAQNFVSLIRAKLTPDKLPYLTILSNVFLGFALGRIIVMPGEELLESVSVRVFLIIGTCLFFDYLLCARKAAKGTTCTPSGKMRPLLRELLLCAAVNASVCLLSLSLFFFKSHHLLS